MYRLLFSDYPCFCSDHDKRGTPPIIARCIRTVPSTTPGGVRPAWRR